MADSKISALAAVTTIGDTDEYVVAVGGATKKITGASIKAALNGTGFPSSLMHGGVVSTASVLNSRIYVARIYGGGTISKIRVRVGTQNGNICVGVYAGPATDGIANAIPGTRKQTSGSVACPAAGIADVALGGSVVVVPGDFFAIMADNNTATFYNCGNGDGSTLYSGLSGYRATAGTTLPLPASLVIESWESKTYIMSGVT